MVRLPCRLSRRAGTIPSELGLAAHHVDLRLPLLSGTLPETVRCNEGLWTFRLSSSSGEASWVSGGMVEGRPTLTRALKGASAPGLPELAPRAGPTWAPLAASRRSCDITTRTHTVRHPAYPASCCVHNCWLRGACIAGACVCTPPWSGIDCGVRTDTAGRAQRGGGAACGGKKRAGIFVDETAYRRYAATTPVPSADYDRAAAAWGARRGDGGRFDCALSPQTAVRPTYRSLDAWTARYDVFDLLLVRLLASAADRVGVAAVRAASSECAAAVWNPHFGVRLSGNVDSTMYSMLQGLTGELRDAALGGTKLPHIYVDPLDRGFCDGLPGLLRPGDVVLTHWGNEDCLVARSVRYIIVPGSSSVGLAVHRESVEAYVVGRWWAQRSHTCDDGLPSMASRLARRGASPACNATLSARDAPTLAHGWRVEDHELAAIARRAYSDEHLHRPRRKARICLPPLCMCPTVVGAALGLR